MGGHSKLTRKRGGNLGGKLLRKTEKNQVATWEEQLLGKSKQNWKFQGMYLYLSSNLPSLICPGNPDIGGFRLFDNLLPVSGSHLLPSPSHLEGDTIYYPVSVSQCYSHDTPLQTKQPLFKFLLSQCQSISNHCNVIMATLEQLMQCMYCN